MCIQTNSLYAAAYLPHAMKGGGLQHSVMTFPLIMLMNLVHIIMLLVCHVNVFFAKPVIPAKKQCEGGAVRRPRPGLSQDYRSFSCFS